MKKLLVLLFSILISFNSYGEWVKVTESATGNTHYVDTDTIKEHNGYVYWWELNDYLKPDKWGDMSHKVYRQGDCDVNRDKPLSYIYYKQRMGEGKSEVYNPPNPEWSYPPPESIGESISNYVCDYVD
tara:strand:- start:261 stop:644 length:384 start_codon:yes stop_codon:yes gene_type:complete